MRSHLGLEDLLGKLAFVDSVKVTDYNCNGGYILAENYVTCQVYYKGYIRVYSYGRLMMETKSFDFDSGELCLDFANTAEWHASEKPIDRLGDYFDLLAWAEATDMFPADWLDRQRRLLNAQPDEAASAYGRAIQLREAIYRIFANAVEEKSASLNDLVTLNKELREALYHLRVSPAPHGFAWQWVEVPARLDQLLWPVARSAGELLTSDQLDRVKECADDRGCGYLFIDTSRNRSRRWCSMESCGNRAKVRQHRERQREAKHQ